MPACTKTSLVLNPVLADTSINKSNSKSLANFKACSRVTNLDSCKWTLFPIKNILISGVALALKSFSHKSKSSKLLELLIYNLRNKKYLLINWIY